MQFPPKQITDSHAVTQLSVFLDCLYDQCFFSAVFAETDHLCKAIEAVQERYDNIMTAHAIGVYGITYLGYSSRGTAPFRIIL